MSGAGSYPAGHGPCGFDPVIEADVEQPADAADALLFDLVTRTFPELPDGSLQEVHWVDASAALALGFELGSIRSAPDVGFNTQRLRRVSNEAAGSVTKDEVRVAMKHLIDPGHITLLSVTVDTRVKGRIAGEVVYFNNRKGTVPLKPTTLRLTSNG